MQFHTHLYLTIGCLFCFVLFCLFDTLRCDKPWSISWHIWYHLKDLGEEGCTDFVSWSLNLWCGSYWISKFLWIWKIELNYHLFWKICYFRIASPNATKQSPCTLVCIELSKFVPILWHLNLWCENYWISKSFLEIKKLKNKFCFYFDCGNGTGHTSSKWKYPSK